MQLKSTNAVFLQTKREYFIVYLFRSFLERFCFPLFVQERGQPPGMGILYRYSAWGIASVNLRFCRLTDRIGQLADSFWHSGPGCLHLRQMIRWLDYENEIWNLVVPVYGTLAGCLSE